MRQRILVSLCGIFLLLVSAIRAEGENVELVGRLPFGSALDIYVVENYAYLCAGGTLIIVDVIDPANPVEVGRVDTPGIACAVYVVGGYAYVADGPQGLRVIDVSDPGNPREVGSYVPFYYRDSGTEILSGIHVVGKYAYMIWRGNLHVVDISDPTNPQEVTIYNRNAMGLHVTGDYAYLTESYGGLHVIDISRPENPQEVGFCEFQGEAEEVYVVGNYAYVAAGYDGLRVIDVSNPKMPREMGSCYIAGYATDVFAAGDLAYVAACSGVLRVIDVSGPKNLREVGACYGPPPSATGVYVAGDYAYLINDPSEFGTLDWSGLAVLDISSSRSLRASGFYYTHNYAEAVQVDGSYAYVADGTAGLRIIDISDPEKPDEIGFYDAPINAIELYVAGNYAYVIDTQEALHIVDVSDPRNPHEVSVYPVYLHDVFVAGNYAYIAASRDGLLVIDVSDPTNPRKVGSYDVPDDSAIISDVYVVGDYAYVIGMKTGFRILNISDPANPRELGYYQISGNICIAGRHAYIGTQVIDISDPANLHRVGYSLEFFRMHIAGSYAYLTKGKDGILVLDISDPARPRQVGSYNTPGYAKGVYAVGDYAYVADGYGGLCILKYVGPSVVGNDPPVGNPESLITDVDTSVQITLTASDPDGDALTFQIETQPINGSLIGTAPNLTYQPNPGFIGTDSFIFTVHDGTVSSKPASVTIKVQHTPVAISQSTETVRDTPVQITLTGSDADGDALTFQIVRQPINGSLSGTAPDLTYEPKPGFIGIDSIIFTVHDGFVNSEPATVSIEIRLPNYHPVADPQTVTTNQNTPVQITLTGTDPDGDELTFEFVQPSYGSLSGTAPNLTYHPKHGYIGKDRFSFSVYDGELWSSPAQVTVIVEKTDRWNVEFVGTYDPRGYAQGVRVAGSYAYVISAKAAGKGIEGLHMVDVSDPAEPYEVAFYEIPGISDGICVSGDYAYVCAQTGTILNPYVHFHVVNISAPGNPYIAGSYRLLESWPGITPKPHGIYVTGGYAYVADFACGLRVIDISNPAIPQQVGLCVCSGDLWDVFFDGTYAYTASIAAGNLYIVDVSDPSKPEQVAWWGSPFDRSYAIYVTDGYAYLGHYASTGLSIFDVFDPKRPRLLGVQGIPGILRDIHVADNLAYVAEFEGGFRVIDVSDPEDLQEVGFYDTPNNTIGIYVSGDYTYIADGWGGLQILKYTGPKPTVNSPPIATPQSLTTNQATPAQITLTGQDPDGDELIFDITSQPENGSLSGSVPDLTYTPNPGFAGEDSLTFRAYDGNSWSEPAIIDITVIPQDLVIKVISPGENFLCAALDLKDSPMHSFPIVVKVVDASNNSIIGAKVYANADDGSQEIELYDDDIGNVYNVWGNDGVYGNSWKPQKKGKVNISFTVKTNGKQIAEKKIQGTVTNALEHWGKRKIAVVFVKTKNYIYAQYDLEYVREVLQNVRIYFENISDGGINLSFEVYPANGEWIELDHDEDDYENSQSAGCNLYRKEELIAQDALNVLSEQLGKRVDFGIGVDGYGSGENLGDDIPFGLIMVYPQSFLEGDVAFACERFSHIYLSKFIFEWGEDVFDLSYIAHEIGHLFGLPDIYTHENEGINLEGCELGKNSRWDLMARGNFLRNPPWIGYVPRIYASEYYIPKQFGEKTGTWLIADPFEDLVPGISKIHYLEDNPCGSPENKPVHRYILNSDKNEYLVFEARNRTATWGSSPFDYEGVKSNEALLLYYYSQNDISESGTDQVKMKPQTCLTAKLYPTLSQNSVGIDLVNDIWRAVSGGNWRIQISIDSADQFGINVKIVDKENAKTSMVVDAKCPVDLAIKDPQGRQVSKDSNDIPDAEYIETDLDGDGDTDDRIKILIPLAGKYSIQVMPEPNAKSTDTYSLQVSYGESEVTEFKDVAIKDIPQDGYVFDTTTNQLSISTASEEKPDLSVSPENLSIQKDDVFTVNIEASRIIDLFGASFELQFNGDILEATGAKPGDALGSDVVFLNVPSEGKISVAISKKEGDEPFSGSGTLATIDFRAKADGRTEITLDKSKLTLQKADGSPIPGFSELIIAPCEITVGQVSQAMISMEPSDVQVKPGDEFTLEAVVSDIDRLFGASFEIQYDGNILEYVSSSAGDFMGNDVVFFSIKGDNTVNMAISMKEGADPASGTGTLAVIKFKARSAGKSQVSYREDTMALNHPDGTPISVTVSNCSVTVGEGIIKGDVNNDGNVRSNDAILALRIASGLIEPNPEQRQAADMNGDGMVRSNDAILILREAAGLAAPGVNALPIANRKVTVTLPESHGVAGEKLTIPLKVDNADLLAGGDICITYDNTVLRALGVKSNLMLVSNVKESGKVYVSFAGVQGLHGNTLADMQFDILRDSVSSLEFDTVELYQPDALPLVSHKINGRFSSWAIPPERSDLMQNFPNPFNPETWIPYQLREGGEVTVRIHSVTGELVRELKLGHKSAGLYVSQDRAAYWDGKSDTGELVSSGVYFYTIQAGDFGSTRKMIIMR